VPANRRGQQIVQTDLNSTSVVILAKAARPRRLFAFLATRLLGGVLVRLNGVPPSPATATPPKRGRVPAFLGQRSCCAASTRRTLARASAPAGWAGAGTVGQRVVEQQREMLGQGARGIHEVKHDRRQHVWQSHARLASRGWNDPSRSRQAPKKPPSHRTVVRAAVGHWERAVVRRRH